MAGRLGSASDVAEAAIHVKDHVVHNDGQRRHRLFVPPPRRVRSAAPPPDDDQRSGPVYRAPRFTGVPAPLVYVLCVAIGAVLAFGSGLVLLLLYLAYR